MPSNASYQRLNTEERRAEQCTASRLLIDTSDYLSIEQDWERVKERWMDRQRQRVLNRARDRMLERKGYGQRKRKNKKRGLYFRKHYSVSNEGQREEATSKQ